MDPKTFLAALNIPVELVSKVYGQTEIKDLKDMKNLFFYTGKGPSNDVMHLGHFLVYEKFAQLSHRYPVMVQVASDEKRSIKSKYIELEKALDYGKNFCFALKKYFDWNPKNTYLIDNLDPATSYLLHNCANYICKHIRLRTTLGAFGNVNLYTSYFLALQLAPVLLFQRIKPDSRCVLVVADDQRACFLILRDLALKLNIKKPIIININPLKDNQMADKMSSSACKKALTVTPTINLQNIKSGVSAPFKNGLPDAQNDYIAHLIDYLVLNNVCAAELNQIRHQYRENQTAATKVKVMGVLARYLAQREVPKKEDAFATLVGPNTAAKDLPRIVKDFESVYLNNTDKRL